MARRPGFLRPAIDDATPEIVARMARVARETGLNADAVIAAVRRFGREGLPLPSDVGECPACGWPVGDVAGHVRLAHPDRILDGTADRVR